MNSVTIFLCRIAAKGANHECHRYRGGASGLMAAITAAKGGHSVTLLERQARVGRKLLSTGNGRCNLTNLNMGLPYYHGHGRRFHPPRL